ncbi:hypothetical protein MEQU1_001866 [Malassezia equina]|uniref:Uncharacterized protein n=1 Tax=Malassezia equina TaxID=1381935 RepID=A0AAF0EEX2_9BASI|nr:hypothetical protein MEQU1_001866 [Malassezia equina]
MEDSPSTQLGITFPWEKTAESTLLGGQAHFLQLDMAELESEEDSEGHDWLTQPTGATSLPPSTTAGAADNVATAQETQHATNRPWSGAETPFDMFEDALLQEHGLAPTGQTCLAPHTDDAGVAEAPQDSQTSTMTMAPKPEPQPEQSDSVIPTSEPAAHNGMDDFAEDLPLHNPHEEVASPATWTCVKEPRTSPQWDMDLGATPKPLEPKTPQASRETESVSAPQAPLMDSPEPQADALGISGAQHQHMPHTWEDAPQSEPYAQQDIHAMEWAGATEEPVRRNSHKEPMSETVPDAFKSEQPRRPPANKTLKIKASRFFKKVLPSKQQRAATAEAPPMPTHRFSRASLLPFRSQKSDPNVYRASSVAPDLAMNAEPLSMDAVGATPDQMRSQSFAGMGPSVTIQRTPPMVPNMLDRNEPSPYYSPAPSLPSSPQTASHRLSFSSFRRQDATGSSKPMSLFSMFKKRNQEPMTLSRQASNGRLPHCKVVEEPLPLAVEAQHQELLHRSHSRRRSVGGWEERESQPTFQPRAPSVVPELSEPECPSPHLAPLSGLPTEQSTVLSHGYETAMEDHETMMPEAAATPVPSNDWTPHNPGSPSLQEPMEGPSYNSSGTESAPVNEEAPIIDEPQATPRPPAWEQDVGVSHEADVPAHQHLGTLSSDTKRLSLGLDENAWTLDLNFGAANETEAHRDLFQGPHAEKDPCDWFSEAHKQAPILPMLSQGSPMEFASE